MDKYSLIDCLPFLVIFGLIGLVLIVFLILAIINLVYPLNIFNERWGSRGPDCPIVPEKARPRMVV